MCTVIDDGWLSPYANSPSNVTMENRFLYCKPNSNHRKGSGACCQLNSYMKYPASSSYHLTRLVLMKTSSPPHFHRLPRTCHGKSLFFRYRRNLLHQQGIVAVHSYAHYNATHMRREKRRSSFKWVVRVQPDLTVICHVHEWHHRLFSRTREHLPHSYINRSIWHNNTCQNVAQ